ncbi:glycosyltransferase [Weissella thailandensis]|nr:glycosyltransferase [Weissella thailandensis]
MPLFRFLSVKEVGLNMRKIFFITSTLPKIHGGRTKSLLQRAHLLNQKGIDITIVSTNYNSEYEETYSFFREQNRVLGNTSFENIYDYYKQKNSTKNVKVTWKEMLSKYVGDFSEYVKVKRSSQNDRTYFYRDGLPNFVVKGLDSGNIEFFALYRDWNFEPFKIFYVNNNGFVHKIETFGENKSRILQEFVTEEGLKYLSKTFKNGNTVTSINLNTASESVNFSNEKELFSYFFGDIFSENDVVVNDARLLDKPLLENKVGKRIFQLHNPHLEDPLDTLSGIKHSFKNILNANLPENSVIVTLTQKQKLDITSEIPSLKNKIAVIPHSTKKTRIQYDKRKNHFGVICRLHPQKNLNDVIMAFYLFDQEIKGYFLDIFGDGESRSELENQVKKLGLDKKVIFHGNVQNVNKAYQQIYALLITSNFEGFPLNALESLSNGTPIITYEVNYGPTDIVDEKSGWVAKSRTPEEFKRQMINAVNNPKNTLEVQERASYFSEENFVSRWLEVIDHDN